MQLEIKHIIPYIEFNLKAEMLDYKCDYVGKRVDTIKGCEQWDKSGTLWSFITVGGSKPSPSRIKPLLRPLEDLNKEEYLPIARRLFNSDILYKCHKRDEFYFIDNLRGKTLPKDITRGLYKNHFDVEYLIEAGLAHDINTFDFLAEKEK